jgi:SAM-dependent methyltransferase
VFAKRRIEAELLDHAPRDQAEANLADLVRLNRRFGGHSVARRVLGQVAKRGERFTLLDVGAASGDTGRLVRELYPGASVISLDQNSVNLAAAPAPKVIGDAFELPFRPASFDYVFASLFLHHFTDDQVTRLLEIFYAAARSAVLICDLERHVVPYFFLPLSKLFFGWSRITVHDGMVSVRAAFRSDELLKLARRAGMRDARVEVYRPAFRLSLIATKTGPL